MKGERLQESLIRAALGECPVAVRVLSVTDSTNNEAKRHAQAGGQAPIAFFAEEQSAGRGRMGRCFYSPPHTGLYLSLLLPIEGGFSDTVGMTTAAAVAVLRAIRSVTGITVGIKWVNDLYDNSRKVCGILAESFLVGAQRYAVIGVGVNLYTEDFPSELHGIAGGLLPTQKNLRNALAAAILAELYAACRCADRTALMAEYRAHSLVLGRAVVYTENQVEHRGVVEAIDDGGRLLVRLSDGALVVLASGEISLRADTEIRAEQKEERA